MAEPGAQDDVALRSLSTAAGVLPEYMALLRHAFAAWKRHNGPDHDKRSIISLTIADRLEGKFHKNTFTFLF